jgi:hypothetical protein
MNTNAGAMIARIQLPGKTGTTLCQFILASHGKNGLQ